MAIGAPYYAASRHTFDQPIEAGFDYGSSLFADDVPILLDNGTGSLVELPVPASWDDCSTSRAAPSITC